jgi:intraflagellar transport protein 56
LELQKSSYCIENELIKHNLVVFRNGENALQVFPKLLDIIPEARLNLAIYHLKRNAIDEAYELIKDLEPIKAQDYILKAVVYAAYGQLYESKEHLQKAQKWFQLVGTSASEMDTIPGRQCMASCFFILRKWDDVILYLNSIKQFFENDDDFLWNLALAHASAGHYKEAEKLLLNIQNENYKQEFCYKAWLTRCYIMNKKPGLAWDIYFKMEASNDSIGLVQLIANECYKTGQFYFAAKAFDVLERIDPNPEYWDGKRGACVGVFQQVLAGEEPVDTLREIINMLRVTKNSQALYIIRIMNEQLGVKASQQVSI